MAKRVIAVVLGLAVAFVTIMGFEQLGAVIFKTPAVDPRDPKTISDLMANMPIAAFLWLLLGYGASAFLGGLLAALLSGRNQVQPALILAAFLTVGSIMNFISTPYHPVWFMVVNLVSYLPLAWAGYLLVRRKETEAEAIKK